MSGTGVGASFGLVGGLVECEGPAYVGIGALEAGGGFSCRLGGLASRLDVLTEGARCRAAAVLGVSRQRGGLGLGALRLADEAR